MTEYYEHGINLSKKQAKKIYDACRNNEGVIIKLSKSDKNGTFKIPMTQTQINKIKNSKGGIQLKLSATQLKNMEKTGGFLPLLSLIPIITGALGAAGGLAGGVASAVSAAKSNAEQARHNKAIEEQLAKSGSGVLANAVGKIPLIGTPLKPLLEKIGLGHNKINKINKGGCVSCNGYMVGTGLYLSPNGEMTGRGLFLTSSPFLE